MVTATGIPPWNSSRSFAIVSGRLSIDSSELGGWIRYHVAPKVSIFTGLPALPDTAALSAGAFATKLGFPLPPLSYQVAVGLNNKGAIAVELPVGLGIQAAPDVYVFAELNLANIKISNTENAIIFDKFIPVGLGGFYSLPKFDLGAVFTDDLKQGADYLQFLVLGRYYVK